MCLFTKYMGFSPLNLQPLGVDLFTVDGSGDNENRDLSGFTEEITAPEHSRYSNGYKKAILHYSDINGIMYIYFDLNSLYHRASLDSS